MWMWIRRWCQHHHESWVIIDIWMREWINIYRLEQVSVTGSLSISFVPPTSHEWQLRFLEQGHSCWNMMNYHSYHGTTTGTEFSPLSTFSPKDRSLSDDQCQWMMIDGINEWWKQSIPSFIHFRKGKVIPGCGGDWIQSCWRIFQVFFFFIANDNTIMIPMTMRARI